MPLDKDSSGPGLVDVLDRVLDKGIVIDAAVRVSVVGVELLSVDARVVVASIETYLRHADTLAYTAMAAAPAKVLPDEPVLYVEPVDAALPPEPTPVALDTSTFGEAVTPASGASATSGEAAAPALEAAVTPGDAAAPALEATVTPGDAAAPALEASATPGDAATMAHETEPPLPEGQPPTLPEAQEKPRDDA